MKIELITIGTELLNGYICDKNGNWLAAFLQTSGHTLNRITVIPDDIDEMKSTIKTCLGRSDVVITSGGMGPTRDDMTKEALTSMFNTKLEKDKSAEQIVIENYKRRNKNWHEDRNHYNMIPSGFIALNNPAGLAPGILYHDKKNNKILVCVPGVPSEFSSMIKDEVFPYLHNNFLHRKKQLQKMIIRTRGIAEEDIFSKLCPDLWDKLVSFGHVSSLPRTSWIDIVVSLFAEDIEAIQSSKKQIEQIIRQTPLQQYVWQFGALSIPEYIIKIASEKNLHISLAESCTGGLVASTLTDISGSSKVFNGGIISYSNKSKIETLGVNKETIEKYGAVSSQTAEEMAKGVLKLIKSDISISLTGIAGPSGGTTEKPVGLVIIGLAVKDGTKISTDSQTYNFKGDRAHLKERFCNEGLFYLLKNL